MFLDIRITVPVVKELHFECCNLVVGMPEHSDLECHLCFQNGYCVQFDLDKKLQGIGGINLCNRIEMSQEVHVHSIQTYVDKRSFHVGVESDLDKTVAVPRA